MLLISAVGTLLVTACRVPIETRPPIANPTVVGEGLVRGTGADGPAFLRFEWFYGDRRGDVRGDGAARFNPTDSLRLDLFTSGEVAMAVALAGSRLSSIGEIEDVTLPSGPLLFAMAGLFRPEAGAELEAYEVGLDTVLVYAAGPDRKLYFFVRGGRLERVEERHRSRLRYKVELTWAAHRRDWPESAEYRDFGERSRVRWTIREIRVLEKRYPRDIFALSHSG
ncbi:MAG: hypothetical protein OEM96_09350 [Gemmatimonadota bacterium]|nr:hypothetical protein [Gemmatimonadota bacterium]